MSVAAAIFLATLFYPGSLIAEEKAAKEPVPLSDRDSEDLIDRIEYDLSVFGGEIAALVPQLKKKKSAKEEIYYVYADDTLGECEFKDLPRPKLEALYIRVRNEATRLNSERIARQLESIRRATQAATAAMPPPQPPRIPKTPEPPPRPPDIPRR